MNINNNKKEIIKINNKEDINVNINKDCIKN